MTSHAPAAPAAKVGVIDIGSNSIRLVAFDLQQGLPLPLFNEKVICRLGQGLVKSGRLAPERTRQALASLRRFRVLAQGLGLERLFVLATAAVRAASNGEAFMGDVERLLDTEARILDGEEEARFAALGVLSGLPDADGVAGDLGGGSLELALIERGEIGPGLSLPLGPLPLMEQGGLEMARAEIDRRLGAVAWLGALKERTLFAVGGAWRALARVEMARTRYPLHIIHGYTLPRAEAAALVAEVVRAAPAALAQIQGVPRHRADTLPLAALLLARVLEIGRPKAVTFSAHGLREGYVHHWCHSGTAAQRDPLLGATAWMSGERGLAPLLPDALMRWTEPMFASDTKEERRLRLAACRLSDIGRSEHPDYRALQAFEAILRAPSLPLRHEERAFLALVAIHRYDGDRRALEVARIQALLPPAAQRRARVLGLALRLAHRLSGGAPALLAKAALEVNGKKLRLRAPPVLRPGDALERDLAGLSAAAGLKGTLEAA
jgi:exopolyphosphatase / guanosine-5'-triphosphate,3'-diphosphate pyrophosphatase